MGLDEIIDKIENDAETRVRQIMDNAKAEADKIIKDAKAKADEKVAKAGAKAANESKMIIARESSKASVEASQMYQERLNDEVGKAMDSIRLDLPEYAKSEDYRKLLQKLALKASTELGDGCVVYVQKADAEKIKPGQGFGVSESQKSFAGGLEAVSKDGDRYVDYTLEALLSGIKDRVAVEVLKLVK
jgi:V/A-type H+-transporting ATPase subunit E